MYGEIWRQSLHWSGVVGSPARVGEVWRGGELRVLVQQEVMQILPPQNP